MANYKCESCSREKELKTQTITLVRGKWEVKEALCKCGKYMDSKPEDGMPNLIRTESSLTKK